MRKLPFHVFLIMVVVLGSFLFVAEVRASALQQFYDRPEVERESIRKAAAAVGMSLEEFLDIINPPPARSSSVNVSLLMIGVSSVVSVASLGTAGYLWKRQKRVEERLQSSLTQRDDLRKEHLRRLQKLVESYFAKHGVYPTEEEFERVRGQKAPLLWDPLEGQERREGGRYSYYYSRRNPAEDREDEYYYRLWCFLEDSTDKETVDGKFILEP